MGHCFIGVMLRETSIRLAHKLSLGSAKRNQTSAKLKQELQGLLPHCNWKQTKDFAKAYVSIFETPP